MTTETTLSEETIVSLRDSLAKLRKLERDIALRMDINQDDGIVSLYKEIRAVARLMANPDDWCYGRKMSQFTVDQYTTVIAPASAEVTNELQSVWGKLVVAVESGGEGAPIFEAAMSAVVVAAKTRIIEGEAAIQNAAEQAMRQEIERRLQEARALQAAGVDPS